MFSAKELIQSTMNSEELQRAVNAPHLQLIIENLKVLGGDDAKSGLKHVYFKRNNIDLMLFLHVLLFM